MDRKLWMLLIVHAMGGSGVCVLVGVPPLEPSPFTESMIVAAFAVVSCESGLLGIWAAMSHTAAWKRILGVYGALTYFSFLGEMSGQDLGLNPAPAITLGVLVVVFLVMRFRKVELRIINGSTHEHGREFQFSIRQLMLLTLTVAVLIALARVLRQMDARQNWIFVLPLWLVFVAAICLASLSATLGLTSPLARSLWVVVVSLSLGWFFPYVHGESDWEAYCFFISVWFLQTLFLLASLFVVRSCGYRLVKRQPITAAINQTTATC